MKNVCALLAVNLCGCNNQQSCKCKPVPTLIDSSLHKKYAWHRTCFASQALPTTGTMYTDGTGAFPMCSFHNMHSVFMVNIYDLNAILVCTMPSKNSYSNNDGAMNAAFKKIFTALNSRGYAPTINIMDNK